MKGTLGGIKVKICDQMKELALMNISWKFKELILITKLWVLELVYVMRF